MKKKTKIIIASCILAVIVAALVIVIVIGKSSSKKNVSEENTIQVWNEKPFDYSENIKTYSSYKQPFSEAVSVLREELVQASKEAGKELNIVSAYMTEENTPTLIIAYNNPDGGTNFMICKFKNSALEKTFIHGGSKDANSMDEALAEYIENEKTYSVLAVTENVESTIDNFVKE